MKRIILVIIGSIAMFNSFASDEVTIKVDGCNISYYNEIVELFEREDSKQDLGMFSKKCHIGALNERRVGRTTITPVYQGDFSKGCHLKATREYYCHRLQW